MRLLSGDTSTSMPPSSSRTGSDVAHAPSAHDWKTARLTKLSRDGLMDDVSSPPKLFHDITPPLPPKLPPVAMPPEGDGWLEITNGVGMKRSTWRVCVQPYPDDRALPIEKGAGFVRLGFEGISRQNLLYFLHAHSVNVDRVEGPKWRSDDSAFDRLDALYGEKQGNFLLIPEVAVELPDYEAGRGRFAAAAQLERVFLRLATTPDLEGDQPR